MKSVVLRLGGLHTEMSFPGCIRHLMAGSEIEDLFELVYAKNDVSHMLSGKAIVQAVRGHFLVDAALNVLLVCNTFNLPLPVSAGGNPPNEDVVQAEQNNPNINYTLAEQRSDTDLELVKVLYEQVIKNPQMANQVSFSKILNSIAIEVNRRQESVNERSTHCCFVAGTHEDGGYSKKVHQRRKDGKLESPPSGCVRYVTLLCCGRS